MSSTFKEIADEIAELQSKKNEDYGGAFEKSVEEFGIVTAVIRLNDKMNRLKTLTKNGIILIQEDSVEDTLKDLAAYSIMTIQSIRKSKTTPK